MPLDSTKQVFFCKWFSQIFFRPYYATAGTVEQSVLARQHDDRGRLEPAVALDKGRGLISIQARHHYIHENYIRTMIRDSGQCFKAIVGGNYIAARLFQERLGAPSNGLAVINNHHLNSGKTVSVTVSHRSITLPVEFVGSHASFLTYFPVTIERRLRICLAPAPCQSTERTVCAGIGYFKSHRCTT